MRILVVEDDHVSRSILTKLLEPYGQIDTAVDGTEALGKYTGQKKIGNSYELIMLDIMMPGLDGREVLREIRRIEESEGVSAAGGVKIVMVTALASYENVSQAFRDQCDGYLTKPVSKKQLEQALDAIGFPPPLG